MTALGMRPDGLLGQEQVSRLGRGLCLPREGHRHVAWGEAKRNPKIDATKSTGPRQGRGKRVFSDALPTPCGVPVVLLAVPPVHPGLGLCVLLL